MHTFLQARVITALPTEIWRCWSTDLLLQTAPVRESLWLQWSLAAAAELNSFFAMKSMPLVTSSYWNLLVGNTPELALQDAEGLRTMRNLAQNPVWLPKRIDAGRQQGIEKPVLE